MEHFLYLTTTGRKSGEPRKIEIWFVEHGDRFYLCAQNREAAQWVQNIAQDPRVTFSVGSRDDEGAGRPPGGARARVVRMDDEPEIGRAVAALMEEKYRWSDGLLVEIAPEG